MALEKTNKVNKSFSAAMMLSMVFAGMHIGTHGNSSIVAHADNVQQNQNDQNSQNEQNSQNGQNNQTYTVKSGDTLSQIAKDNNTTVDDLKGLNSLNSDLIHPDQQLKVTQQATTYTVKDGDTLSQIAKDNNTTVDNLHELNSIQDNNKIYVNQQLKLVDDQNQTQQAQPAQQVAPAQQTQTTNTSQLNGTVKQKAVQLAQQFANMNIPYVWGGSTPSGFDCSGLTAYVYSQLGINIGRNTVAQEGHVTTKAVSQAEPGDLLFWGSHGSTYHVAIYIGNNQYVAAPEPGQNVQVQTINSYFMPSFAGSVNG